jgi:hypothetical protein
MRFFLSVINDGTNTASESEAQAIDDFNDMLVAKGYRIIAEGVEEPSTAYTFDNRNDAGIVEKKPFIESKEFLNGFWVVEVPDAQIAHELALAASKACNRKIELRPMYR